jgi:hypothetical protein
MGLAEVFPSNPYGQKSESAPPTTWRLMIDGAQLAPGSVQDPARAKTIYRESTFGFYVDSSIRTGMPFCYEISKAVVTLCCKEQVSTRSEVRRVISGPSPSPTLC